MDEQDLPGIIPTQTKGSQTDIAEKIICSSTSEAEELYEQSKTKLFDVNNWQKWCGQASATFTLTDANGEEINSTAKAGNYFKIDVPGPGSLTGDGFDWVRIERVEEDFDKAFDAITVIRVRPASNPTNNKEDVAHFFSDEATSSFLVYRSGSKVCAEVHGRNEKPNIKADKLIDKTRNALMATGAIAGISDLQWKSLVKGLIDRNKKL